MNGAPRQSPYQFAVLRWGLGLFLAAHFTRLILTTPGAAPRASAHHAFFPNPLALFDGPLASRVLLAALALAAVALAAGIARRTAALLVLYGWACLLHHDPRIGHPGLLYLGLILLLCALAPRGEGLSLSGWRADRAWRLPVWLWRAAFFALMAGYTFSGVMQVVSPAFGREDAWAALLTHPVGGDWLGHARLFAPVSPLLGALAWLALAGELLALPLALFRRGRPLAWIWMLAVQLGAAATVGFAALSVGRLLVHLVVFDPRWLGGGAPGVRRIVFFDGVCALCNASVDLLLAEDSERRLRFAPLQGATAAAEPRVGGQLDEAASEEWSLVYLRGEDGDTEILTRSDGVLAILADLGGFWRVVSWLRIVPRPVRDAVYRLIARYRYRWFGRRDTCRLPSADERDLFLD